MSYINKREERPHHGSRKATSSFSKMAASNYLLFAILACFASALFSESLFAPTSWLVEAATTSNAVGSAAASAGSSSAQMTTRPLDANGRPQLMVAIYCGQSASVYYNQYLDVDSRKWRSDRADPTAVCTHDKQAILSYCKKVYPNHDIRNIVESSRPYKLDNWCRLGSNSKRRCRARLSVRPYRCLEGSFQSDALLVPERCVFDHVHNKSVCESLDHWNKSAGEICSSKGMRLQSFGMLQPCGLDVFSGVEFVCCPGTGTGTGTGTGASQTTSGESSSSKSSSSSAVGSAAAAVASQNAGQQQLESGNSFAQAANGVLANLAAKHQHEPKYEIDGATSNEIKTDEEAKHQQAHSVDSSPADSSHEHDDDSDEDDDDGEYDEEPSSAIPDGNNSNQNQNNNSEDNYDDDSTSWASASDKSSSAPSSSTTSTTTTTTSTTTTTTTERPIERYLSHFDLAHERDDFRKAELAVERAYQEKVEHVMREWSQLDGRYEEMKKKGDLQAAEEFKQKMTQQFKKTVEAYEKESATQRHQLAAMHAERAMAIINRRKKAAMDCLTQALDRMPIRSRQVERCIVRLLKALEKDRAHTLRQYRNLLNLNTREALSERKIILEHLVTLNRAANQSIQMLDRSPKLVNKLKGKIVTLWHKLRNIPLNEPIVRESEEKIMDLYEEEAARRKIEHERKRLADQEAAVSFETASKVSEEPTGKASSSESSTNVQNQDTNKAVATAEYPASVAPKPQTDSTESTSTTTSSVSSSSQKQTVAQQQQQQQPQQESPSSGHAPDHENEISNTINNQGDNKQPNHYQAEAVNFAHLRMEAPYHELSYSVKHEPLLHSHMKFSISTVLMSMAAVVLLAFIGVKYHGKNSTRAYRRQGFAEVGRSCPEEKNVTHMQFNGYENPAYKFFEAEA